MHMDSHDPTDDTPRAPDGHAETNGDTGFSVHHDPASGALRLSGPFTISAVTRAKAAFDDVTAEALENVDLSKLTHLDTAGAWALVTLRTRIGQAGRDLKITGASDEMASLLEPLARLERPDDVEEVCDYVQALTYCRREIARPKGQAWCLGLRLQRSGLRVTQRQPEQADRGVLPESARTSR